MSYRLTERNNDTDALVRVIGEYDGFDSVVTAEKQAIAGAGNHVRMERDTPDGWEYV